MKIFPAMDLKNEKCVRLYQGDFAKITEYNIEPQEVIKNYRNQGAQYLHIVDLDGAKIGAPVQNELISKLAKMSHLNTQVGGGIRSREQIADYLDKGINRVIVGSVAIKHPELMREWLDEFGAEQIVFALDIKLNSQNVPLLATQGWQELTAQSLWQLLDSYQDCAIQHLLCTDIGRDGTEVGPNVSLYQMIMQRYPTLQLQASGGVGKINHISELNSAGIDAVVIGKAFYENKFTLQQALAEVGKNAD